MFIVDGARKISQSHGMRLKNQLLTVTAAYATAIERSEARVSTIVFGAGNAIARLRNGKDMGTERAHDAIQWFSDHWPAGSAWPGSVPRPAKRSHQSSLVRKSTTRRRQRDGTITTQAESAVR